MEKYEILKKLISFNTVEDTENKEIIDYISKLLKKKGFEIEYITDNIKKCLIARTKKDCELAFLGHSDTVAYSDGWDTNPFELLEKDSKLFGLGVCDMKGGIAAFLEALDNINIDNLSKGIMIIITFDEEIGFSGAKLIKYRNDIPSTIIIGEPTDNEIIVSSKGCIEYEIIFKGKAVHSSLMTQGDNAILKCMEFIKELSIFADSLKKDTNSNFLTDYTTNNISIIEGGDCINKVPDKCKLLFDFRTVYESHNEIINKEIDKLANKYNTSYKLLTDIKPFNNTNNEKINVVKDITNSNVSGANFVSDGNFLVDKDIFIIGPGPVTAHEENEYIDVSSFNKSIEAYQKIIEHFCK